MRGVNIFYGLPILDDENIKANLNIIRLKNDKVQ